MIGKIGCIVIVTILTANIASAQNINQTSQDPFTLGVHIGYPFSFPDNLAYTGIAEDIMQTGLVAGAQIIFDKTFIAGLSFDYMQFHEIEAVFTTEDSPVPKGEFTPKVYGQFYSVVAGYNPFAEQNISPLIYGKFGIISRQHSLCLDVEDLEEKTKDSGRFAYSLNFGVNIRISQKFRIVPSFTYFKIPDKITGNWEYSFNSARAYISANLGLLYNL